MPEGQESTPKRLLRGVIRWVKEQEVSRKQPEDIGNFIEKDKDVSHYERRLLWDGSALEYRDNNKDVPVQAILQRLSSPSKYGFRAVSGKELEAIIAGNGIGGQQYKGTVVHDGTLFSPDLGAPLSMFDGRTYGGDDDRYKGGYIIAIEREVLTSHAESRTSAPHLVYKVVQKIPLKGIHAIFRVDRSEPAYASADDTLYRYSISQIVPKVSK